MSILLKSLLTSLVASQGVLAIGTAFGYGAGATGGGSATAAIPSSTDELISWYVGRV
jgi:pectin lyase